MIYDFSMIYDFNLDFKRMKQRKTLKNEISQTCELIKSKYFTNYGKLKYQDFLKIQLKSIFEDST